MGDFYNLRQCITHQWMSVEELNYKTPFTSYEPLQWQQDPNKVKGWELLTPPTPNAFKSDRRRLQVSKYRTTSGEWLSITHMGTSALHSSAYFSSRFMSTSSFSHQERKL